MKLDKRRLIFDRTHVFKTNGYYELPFGRGKSFASNANGLVDRVIGGWQISGTKERFTPNAVGALPAGSVTRLGDGVTHFAHVKQIADPAVANLTTMGNLQSLSTTEGHRRRERRPDLRQPRGRPAWSFRPGRADRAGHFQVGR